MCDRPRALVPASGGAGTETNGRVRQLDVLRVLTCFSVIAFHAVSGSYPPDDPRLGVATSLLHYGREVFFFVSALALALTYMPRIEPDGHLPNGSSIRRRRLTSIGVPYLLWTGIYLLVWVWHVRHVEPVTQIANDLPLTWVYLLATGNGSYHLYFLLVTIQVSAVLPLFLRILYRARLHLWWLLSAAFLVQVGTLVVYHVVLLPKEGWRAVIGDSSLLAYQFWLVAGGATALHFDRIHSWVLNHRKLVLIGVPLGAAALLWNYWLQVPTMGVLRASTPLQPMMIPWSLIMIAALYVGAVWLSRLPFMALQRTFDSLARLSFGIYLAHPLVLDLVLSLSRRLHLFHPSPWLVVAAFVLTSAGTVLMCAVLSRTRYSRAFIGRDQRRRHETVAMSRDPSARSAGGVPTVVSPT